MTESGDTEWNVFLDAHAYDLVLHMLPPSVRVYAAPVGASLDMFVDRSEFEQRAAKLTDKSMGKFLEGLGRNFLGAGEAKWWDAQLAVAAVGILAGQQNTAHDVCAEWETANARISLAWKGTGKNTYGSVVEDPSGHAVEFCASGEGKRETMSNIFWDAMNDTFVTEKIADSRFYFAPLIPL